MKDVLVVTVPRGGVKPDDFGRFREYVIESILRDVLVLDDSMTMEVQQVPELSGPPVAVVEKTTEEAPTTKRLKEREIKQAAMQRLQDYRQKNGVGSLAAVAKKATRSGITADTLRLAILGEATLTLADWTAIGKALDRLGAAADGA